MAPEKVTVMVLKVDLECPSCYKKVKKVLCKIPQIRDQVFDAKQNTVTVTVMCCSPETIRDKLCYKGGKSIKSIEIKDKDTPKPKEADKPKPAEKPKEPEKKPKDAGKPKDAPEPEKPKSNGTGDKPKSEAPAEKAAEKVPKDAQKSDPPKKSDQAAKPEPAKMPEQAQGHPSVFLPVYPVSVSYGQYYDGYGGGLYRSGYGVPIGAPPPGPSYDGYAFGYGYGPGYGDGDSVPGYAVRYDYFSEENQSGCSIM